MDSTMQEPGLLFAVLVAAGTGTLVGFGAGLVPGLHMNNIAAAVTAYTGGALALFSAVGALLQMPCEVLMASCFISSGLIAHMFAQAVTSSYVGIPSSDVVSVLPAHRLAKAGFGRVAVTASADGAMAGVLLSVVLLAPVSMLMGDPGGLYAVIRKAMLGLVLLFSGVLLASEGLHGGRPGIYVADRLMHFLEALDIFLAAGVIGTMVLRTNYFACPIPDLPWMPGNYVPESSLLLPMFAGLFGIPGLVLSLGSRPVSENKGLKVMVHHHPTKRDILVSLLGGIIVGWMPGMTSGSAVALCSPRTGESGRGRDMSGAVRFIWLYSAISSSGAVFAVGALFTIMRARSGSMDAVLFFLGNEKVAAGWSANAVSILSIILSMLVAAAISRIVLTKLNSGHAKMHAMLCSRSLALGSLAFVVCLSLVLTGTRGALLLATAATLGFIPPLVRVRRIQLMGSLLVPIVLAFVS